MEQEMASKPYKHFVAHTHLNPRAGGSMAIGYHVLCFFHTLEGHRGLYPPMAQHRDINVVYEAGQVPYLLRP